MKTKKQFICRQGKIEKTFNIDRFSNGSLTKEEFDLWKIARSKAGQKPFTKEECMAMHQKMHTLKNKNFNNEEIQEHINSRIEEKVLAGEIAGLDVPYQMTHIKTQIDELRLKLLNLKFSQADRSDIKEKIDHKNFILAKLLKLNKEKLRKLGVQDEDDEKMSDVEMEPKSVCNT